MLAEWLPVGVIIGLIIYITLNINDRFKKLEKLIINYEEELIKLKAENNSIRAYLQKSVQQLDSLKLNILDLKQVVTLLPALREALKWCNDLRKIY